MKAQALLLLICGFTALATAATVTDPAATVTVQPNSTALETVFHTVTNFHPQASTSTSSLLLAKRPTLSKKSDDDDDVCIPGSLSPLELTCENFGKDVKCHRHSYLKNPFGDRADTFVACIQSCRKDSGLNYYIYYKGRYLDMSLEEYDEWIRNGAEHQTAASAAASTTTEAAATITVWTNLATTNQPQSTGFQTSFRTVSSSAPLASASVLLDERSVSEQEDSAMQSCHDKAAGQQKCRTKCGFAGIQNGKCYSKCMAKWAKKHCPSDSNAGLMQRSEDTETTEAANESAIVERDVQGDNHDNHHCNNDSVQRKCRWKASWHVFDKEKHYNRCIQKCVRKHNGDNYDQPEEYGDALLTKRSEAVDEATTAQNVKLATSKEDHGDKGPCDTGTWAEVWCGVKSNWHWNRQKAYEKCIDKCLRDHRSDAVVTKRSDNETTDNNTTLDTTKLASTTVSLSKRTDFPYNGQLGEANDNDNHHCNNTWVQIKCSAKSMWFFWAYKKHFFGCIAECVAERNGDNWKEEDTGCDGEEQVKL